ncbi:MAG: hypothetical protein WCC67_04930, partial [Candidatus Acidiferrales bacterium]
MPAIRIASSSGSYAVHCAPRLLARAGSLVSRLGDTTGIFVLSSPRVWTYWGRPLIRALRGRHRVTAILFDDSEHAK